MAVGYVCKSTSSHPVNRYWPAFRKELKAAKTQPNLQMYFDLAKQTIHDTANCGEARNILISGLARLLNLEGIKAPNERNISTTMLPQLVRSIDNDFYAIFVKKLAHWCLYLANDVKMDWNSLAQEVCLLLTPLTHQGFRTKEANNFLVQPSEQLNTIEPSLKNTNIYEHFSDQGQVRIMVDSIHAVKGQTHTATLMLETHWYDYDLKTLLPYLYGQRLASPGVRIQKRLNLAYVAMTRPTDLVCIAMHSEHVSDDCLQKLDRWGWHIEELGTQPRVLQTIEELQHFHSNESKTELPKRKRKHIVNSNENNVHESGQLVLFG